MRNGPLAVQIARASIPRNAPNRHARVAITIAVALMVATSVLLAFQIPTFDFDEALYRRAAEEMKASHHYGALTWDARPFLEKPPTYVWTIVASSRLIDGDSRVSVIAARLPSLLFSFLTVVLLCLFWYRFGPEYAAAFDASDAAQRVALSSLLPAVAFGAALFPMVQVTSVLLDPMLTFFTTIVLLVFCAAELRRDSPALRLSPAEGVVAGFAMAAAVAVKGLIGIGAPAIALVVHDILTTAFDDTPPHRLSALRHRLVGTLKGAAPAFGIGVAVSAMLYALFWRAAGSAFLYEFVIRQHFGRGTTAFQGHRGPVFYYLLLLFAGGPAAAFTCVTLGVKRPRSFSFARWGFPLSWSAGLIAFISLLATKLPNYTWPAWSAIALALCILLLRASLAPAAIPPATGAGIAWPSVVCAWIGIAATAMLCAAAAGLSMAFPQIVLHLNHSSRTEAILDSLLPLPLNVRVGLGLIAIGFALQTFFQGQYLRRVAAGAAAVWGFIVRATALNCLILVIASTTAIPYMDQRIRMPLVRMARLASDLHVAGDNLTTIGLFSPTISSNYSAGKVTQIGTPESRRTTTGRELRITPLWRAGSCLQPDFRRLEKDEYLLLCAATAPPVRRVAKVDRPNDSYSTAAYPDVVRSGMRLR